MVPFSSIITYDGTITFTHYDGTVHHVTPASLNYDKVKNLIRSIGDNEVSQDIRDDLYNLSKPAHAVFVSTSGAVKVEGGQVYYNGEIIRNFLAERILWMLESGFSAGPMLAFLEKVKLNPSNRAVEELYRFMEHNRMGLTPDGDILTYKRVRPDYKDIRTGTFDNSVGSFVNMARNEVDDDPRVTCSHGLHVCAESYLPQYATARSNRIVVCRVHPKDVVSVPFEYHNAKMRVCAYTVIEDVTDKVGILAEKAVFDFVGEDEDCLGSSTDFTPDSLGLNTDSISSIYNSVVELLRDDMDINIPDIANNTLKDLGLDDLDLIELIMGVEKKTGVSISDDDDEFAGKAYETVADFAKFIHGLIKR